MSLESIIYGSVFFYGVHSGMGMDEDAGDIRSNIKSIASEATIFAINGIALDILCGCLLVSAAIAKKDTKLTAENIKIIEGLCELAMKVFCAMGSTLIIHRIGIVAGNILGRQVS